MLDEAGFASAARWYSDGFAERSGIKVNINLPAKLDRLHKDSEIALFRALQEGLTKAHRHSGASAVDICVRVDGPGTGTPGDFNWETNVGYMPFYFQGHSISVESQFLSTLDWRYLG